MKEKSGKCKRAMLVLLFTLATITLLPGTATAVTHTEVESVTRYAPAGPAPGAEFEVTLRITGELPLVVGIVETIPAGFSFVSTTHPSNNYSASGQKVAFAVIDKKEIKYTVKAPSSGEGTFSGTWIDMLNEKEGSIADTIVMVGGGGAGAIEEGVTPTPSPKPVVLVVTKAARTVLVMEAGKEVAMVFKDMDVSMVTMKADKEVSDARVVVERVEKSPDIPAPSGIPYVYLDIKVENAGGAKVEGKIEFKVAKSWISANNIDEATVKLNRYDRGEWKALPTYRTGEDNVTVYFEAETPGFSLFAVTGEKKVEAAATTPAPVATATPVTTPTPSPTPPPASKVPGFEAIFATVSLLIAYTMMFRKKGRGGRGGSER